MTAYRSERPRQTVRTGLPVHECQYKTAWTDCQDRTLVQDCQDRTPRTRPQGHDFRDRFCSDIVLILDFILALSLNLKGLWHEFFCLSLLRQTLPLGQNWHLVLSKMVLLWKLYLSRCLYPQGIYRCLQWQWMKKWLFPQFFFCLYILPLNFLYSQFYL